MHVNQFICFFHDFSHLRHYFRISWIVIFCLFCYKTEKLSSQESTTLYCRLVKLHEGHELSATITCLKNHSCAICVIESQLSSQISAMRWKPRSCSCMQGKSAASMTISTPLSPLFYFDLHRLLRRQYVISWYSQYLYCMWQPNTPSVP